MRISWKTRVSDLEKMALHEKADQNFYVSTNLVMNLAKRTKEIFESSEPDEKRELLNLVFQNLQLSDVNLSVQVQEPFLTMLDFKNRPKESGRLDAFRTFDWKRFETLSNITAKIRT